MPKTVVIADDHPSFRASARAILESEGFQVVGEAEDGEAAIAAMRDLNPDVLLLDVQLPDMDGFAVCRELGLNGGPPAVVLVSSRPSPAAMSPQSWRSRPRTSGPSRCRTRSPSSSSRHSRPAR